MMQQAISYRDKNGFVIVQERSVYRFITHKYASTYDHLMRCGLYQELVDAALLITHTESILTPAERKEYYKILVPDIIPCITYPYEWSAVQWKEVVLAFLRINCAAIKYGMILKDATPFNFSFHRGKCVFFDTLSFDLYRDGEPWIGYRQFCESMLGPLSLMRFNSGEWAGLLAASINGWELPFISRNLPLRSFFSSTITMHIHWHATYSNAATKPVKKKHSFNSQKLLVLWKILSWSINRWKIKTASRNWSDYYETGIDSEKYIHTKTTVITEILKRYANETVIDLGANTGRFSMVAAAYATQVISVEPDQRCIDALRKQAAEQDITNITTLVSDIVQPSPGIGWNNEERQPLLKRLSGDLVMALALVHHLCIGRNVPLRFVARLIAGMTTDHALVEFVPKSDPKIQQMLAGREDIFDDYNDLSFIHSFNEYFFLEEVYPLSSSGRKLFVWRKR